MQHIIWIGSMNSYLPLYAWYSLLLRATNRLIGGTVLNYINFLTGVAMEVFLKYCIYSFAHMSQAFIWLAV